MNNFGTRLRISIFGESHGPGVGVLLDGLPPGLPIDVESVQRALDQRRPGASRLVSARKETDVPEILSGVQAGKATGAPLCISIRNRDVQSAAYAEVGQLPRPGHADWVNHVWSRGNADLRGAGHSSGRLTAPIVAAGAVAQAILDGHKILCAAHLQQVGEIQAPAYQLAADAVLRDAPGSPVFTAHKGLEGKFMERIEAARAAKDSVGGAVEFTTSGVPLGLGDPFFDSVESRLAHLLFSMPAVKGVEVGAGFRAAAMAGSQHNDPLRMADGKVTSATNHAGGILGGRTNGSPVCGRVAIKPASSIASPQPTVDLGSGRDATVETTGRHDPCIAVRAVPVVQACLRLVLADFVLLARQEGHLAAPR